MLTRKEIRKVLLEWKNFLSEAVSSSKTVQVYDFDSTLVSYDGLDTATVQGMNYFSTYLRPYAFKKILKIMKEKTKPLPLFDQIAIADHEDSYIVCQVNSAGFPKEIDTLVGYINKYDPKFYSFLKLLCTTESGSDKDSSQDKDLFIHAFASANNEEEAAKKQESAEKLIKKFFRFEVDGESIDVNEYMNTKKETIKAILKDKGISKFPSDHIIMTSNLAESSSGTTSGIAKGTSGKFRPGVVLGNKYPEGTLFQVYDNQTAGLGQFKKGILAARKGSNNELSSELDRLSAEYAEEKDKKKKAMIKSSLEAIQSKVDSLVNIETYKVTEGVPEQVHNVTTSKSSATGQLDLGRMWEQLRVNVFRTFFQGRYNTAANKVAKVIEHLSTKPHLAAVINDILDKPSGTLNLKRLLTALPNGKIESASDYNSLTDYKAKSDFIAAAKKEQQELIPVFDKEFPIKEKPESTDDQTPKSFDQQVGNLPKPSGVEYDDEGNPMSPEEEPDDGLAEHKITLVKESLNKLRLVLKNK